MLQRDEARPLILMTPKSLLRNQAAACYIEEFTNGEFQPVIEQPGLGTIPEKVERIVFCTGRIAVELADHVNGQSPMEWLDIIRVEELYPFPQKDIMKLLNRYKNLKEVIWVQEEPKNMGAYRYWSRILRKLFRSIYQSPILEGLRWQALQRETRLFIRKSSSGLSIKYSRESKQAPWFSNRY